MIKLEHVVLPSPKQMEFIIEGMRNPMNSWEKSDTDWYKVSDENIDDASTYLDYDTNNDLYYLLGHNDLELMMKLSNAGTDHRKFMRMMPVYVRITAPLYWWKEFDTYKVGTVANSCSTMHKIQEKEFTLEDFSCEHLGVTVPAELNDGEEVFQNLWLYSLEETIFNLNIARRYFNDETNPELKKKYWWQMIQLLPSSYNQTRNVMLNYEVLANIYKSRKNHKLDEWRVHETPEEHKFRNKDFASGKWGFCDWIESLPYSELITDSESLKNNIEKALGHGVTPNVDIDDLKTLTFVPNVAREAVGLKPVIEEKEY